MNKKLYILFITVFLSLLLNKSYGQQATRLSPEAMKQKIATSLSVSEQRAEEVHQALSYNQGEIYQVLSSKKLHDKGQMARLKQLVSSAQAHIAGALTAGERAKLETLVSPEIRQRKAAALQKIQLMRQQQGSAVNKKN